ncbi:MAG TPA: hypothetical protein PK453_20680 [Leptospiraceae bacterium]|nr:hypothetical protein [Leptospiraceae bacterium]HNF16089.1 hypothetical protein [Leptospiraceae bacterium]HNF28404.1 hypothetical protein [Leptospiraceae bacterium]HNH09390.1 hypothetical protein [Leptospiraceae bacterium]HNI99554.1 hypothetical protein [Leptospiraceae bacterium]
MNRKENAAKVSFSEYSEEVMNMRTLLENLAEQLRNQPKVRKRKLYKKVRISRKKILQGLPTLPFTEAGES